MRIFERLRSRANCNADRSLFEVITGSLLEALENEPRAPVLAVSHGNSCSCCSADSRTIDRHQG
jgi:hypothetical protein